MKLAMNHYVERVVDLLPPGVNELEELTVAEARGLLEQEGPAAMQHVSGSFALVARHGKTVRMAKKTAGPVLVVADRIDAIHAWLVREGLGDQFHPGYTRMVPAHHVVELELIGCPDPDPVYTRFFTPQMGTLPADTRVIGERYVAALADEIAAWLKRVPARETIGVCFSGGIDSGSVFLLTYWLMKRFGLPLGRLKAFTLDAGGGPDLGQARAFLDACGLGLFLEPIEAGANELDPLETIRIIEDYKCLDVQSATMALALLRGVRKAYPAWRYLIDGDGGDENLKDYPIEENPELTIRSVVHNPMLYQEGWGVGKIKHSLTYSGGLSRSYTRNYAPVQKLGFSGFSPYTRPGVIAVAEAIPFIALTEYSVPRLYALKGEIVAHGVKALTGIEMPVYEKRRFQHGAMGEASMRRLLPAREAEYRRQFLAMYA